MERKITPPRRFPSWEGTRVRPIGTPRSGGGPQRATALSRAGGQLGRAVRAEAEHVDDVVRLGEAVLSGDIARPLLDGVGRDLDSRAATPADQVVVMAARRAGAVEAL